MLYPKLLDQLKTECISIFSENLTGIYLHGSLAMGGFNPLKSDIDLIIIVENDITDTQCNLFLRSLLNLYTHAPSKGLELSIIKRKHCRPFIYPTPYEFHFSNMHVQDFLDHPDPKCMQMKGVDPDLAAHFTVIKHHGIVLYGENINNVFSDVPREHYIDSVWQDIKDAETNILVDPVYTTLNLCRSFAFFEEGLILSKQDGGKWALHSLPEIYHPIISEALTSYNSDSEMKTSPDEALPFARDMLRQIQKKMN